MPAITRRDFLMAAGVTLSAGALVAGCRGAGSGGAGPTPPPPAAEPAPAETPHFHYGDDQTMNKRILVTYATRTGSTVGVAAAIGETLSARGFAVDVRPSRENPSPEGYQAIITGSAINGAQWLPEAVEYVQKHRQALSRVPVALFSVHIMNLGDDEQSRQNRLAYLDAVRPLLKPTDAAFFAGLGSDPAKMSWFERWAYRKFKVGPEGDCRDWNRIRGWAESIQV